MEELKIKVGGMHCGSCEALVKEDVGEIDGVKSVHASHKDGTVIVKYEGKLDAEKVKNAITALGYTVKD
ncbi:MAG: heavy metal-associated domain-containing protein [Candidatus Altiarchaeota archaeon]